MQVAGSDQRAASRFGLADSLVEVLRQLRVQLSHHRWTSKPSPVEIRGPGASYSFIGANVAQNSHTSLPLVHMRSEGRLSLKEPETKSSLLLCGLEAQMVKTQILTVVQCIATWSRVTRGIKHCALPTPAPFHSCCDAHNLRLFAPFSDQKD